MLSVCATVLGCIWLESVFMCVCVPVWEVSSVERDECACAYELGSVRESQVCPPTGAEGYFLCEQKGEAALGT